jgi:ribosome-associated protein
MIEASRFRSQERNREDARERLKELILEAAEAATAAAPQNQADQGLDRAASEGETGRGEVKKMRGRPSGE